MGTQRICAIPGCDKRARTRGWCDPHYRRWRRNGDPLGGNHVPGEALAFLEEALRTAQPGDCMTWPYSTNQGRGRFQLNGKSVLAHRYACEHMHGPPPSEEHFAAHNCGKGHLGCFSPFHVRWATPASNSADRLIHGTLLRGDHHPRSKLTEEEVREIRRSSKAGEYTHRQLAARFGVSRRTVAAAASGQNWAWLD